MKKTTQMNEKFDFRLNKVFSSSLCQPTSILCKQNQLLGSKVSLLFYFLVIRIEESRPAPCRQLCFQAKFGQLDRHSVVVFFNMLPLICRLEVLLEALNFPVLLKNSVRLSNVDFCITM